MAPGPAIRLPTTSPCRIWTPCRSCWVRRGEWGTGPYARPAWELLRARQRLRALVRAYHGLAGRVAARQERMVITHGEPHAGNVLVTGGGLVLVDWDTTLLALPERDLWDLAGVDRAVLHRCAAATGTAIDEQALTLYRLGYDLAEIGGYLTLFRSPHANTADTRESWTTSSTSCDLPNAGSRWSRRAAWTAPHDRRNAGVPAAAGTIHLPEYRTGPRAVLPRRIRPPGTGYTSRATGPERNEAEALLVAAAAGHPLISLRPPDRKRTAGVNPGCRISRPLWPGGRPAGRCARVRCRSSPRSDGLRGRPR